MGLFDYIKCEMPLPGEPKPPDTLFQTKDTDDQYMTVYTITTDGKLTWRPYVFEAVPPSERPFPNAEGIKGLRGSIRRKEDPPAPIPYHGDITFYHLSREREWWEYRARFTEGVCTRITLEEHRPPTGDE